MIDCTEMRRDILRMALAAKSSGAHLGGSLSLVEIMCAFYDGAMNWRVDDPNRDRLVFSKGHGVMAQYAALRQVGLLSAGDLKTYKATGSVVCAHPSVHQKRLGIDYASGSLGMGLSLGVGCALAMKRKRSAARVFVVLGDGECDEGSIWEAAQSAAHFGLDNLTVVVDKNGLQYDGLTDHVMNKGDLVAKWRAFGWDARSVDGHDVIALREALRIPGDRSSGAPFALVADTVKGKGISFMENVRAWHHGVVTQRVFDQAMAELGTDND